MLVPKTTVLEKNSTSSESNIEVDETEDILGVDGTELVSKDLISSESMTLVESDHEVRMDSLLVWEEPNDEQKAEEATVDKCTFPEPSNLENLDEAIEVNDVTVPTKSKEESQISQKTITNLDLTIERVVNQSRIDPEKEVPILNTFYKEQLKNLTRQDLEELFTEKLCEDTANKSEIKELTLRCIVMEHLHNQWKKKVKQLEKSHRELEMVFDSYLLEARNTKKERQPLPIKVVRSVGLQVNLASSGHVSGQKSSSHSQQSSQHQMRLRSSNKESNPPISTTLKTPLPVVDLSTPAKTPTPAPTSSPKAGSLEVIDLADKEEKNKQQKQQSSQQRVLQSRSVALPIMKPRTRIKKIRPPQPVFKHPAPVPLNTQHAMKQGMKVPPPEPQLKVENIVDGIKLLWNMEITEDVAHITSYQVYACEESSQPPNTALWKKVADIKALPLPMACSMTKFVEGRKYHFSVRAVDVHSRTGPFSVPGSILFTSEK